MKKDKFAQHIATIKRHENHIATMEMLLGATYDDELRIYVKSTKSVSSHHGMPMHWTSYYNRHGEEISPGEVKNMERHRMGGLLLLGHSRGKSRWA